MKNNELTKKEKLVFDYLVKSIDENGYIKLWDFVKLQGVIDITRKRFAGYDFTDEEKVFLSLD